MVGDRDPVEPLFHQIQDLVEEDRGRLFNLLGAAYDLVRNEDRVQRQRPWADPRYRFSDLQCRLLTFLDGQGATRNLAILDHLWRDELANLRPRKVLGRRYGDAAEHRSKLKVLHVRLRRLKADVNRKFVKLMLGWRLTRPRNGCTMLEQW
jgi:hypothetical protein